MIKLRDVIVMVIKVLKTLWSEGIFASEPAVAESVPDVPVITDTNYEAARIKRAVVCGLTAVNPAHYNGWRGDCPGCDLDAQRFAALCRRQGVQTIELHNEQITKEGLIAAARVSWEGMSRGDLFVLYISGHGGQEPDTSGDEADGYDETLCLWDGTLSDDILFDLWNEMPEGVRVFFVADTCNSGTNYKMPRGLIRTIPQEYMGQLIHYGGCADGKSSYGGSDGGEFTNALLATYAENATYRYWFTLAALKMSRNQIPMYEEYGAVDFADRKVFE